MVEGMRAERRRELYALLGELPERHRPIGAELTAREERDQYVLEVLLLDGDVALRLSVASERLDLVENGAVRHHDSAICQQQQQPASDLRSC
jgi:hypothetical protein